MSLTNKFYIEVKSEETGKTIGILAISVSGQLMAERLRDYTIQQVNEIEDGVKFILEGEQ